MIMKMVFEAPFEQMTHTARSCTSAAMMEQLAEN